MVKLGIYFTANEMWQWVHSHGTNYFNYDFPYRTANENGQTLNF